MSDPNVLAAQEWVNSTYGDVPGYVPCQENGKTGWHVVLSLTQALQHELGISPVVQNFGSNTLAAVRSRNKRPWQETDTNIIRIYNFALWCKGYSGSTAHDRWDVQGDGSLFQLGRDMAGDERFVMDADADLWARVSKALLRMDQFRVIQNGDSVSREFQQQLNRRYVGDLRIPAMDLVPCDGYFERVTQQGLMMSIQYEIGIPKSEITGYFGEGTKAGLKKYLLGAGDEGDLVYLLHAACHFNSPAYGGDSGSGYHPIPFPWAEIKAAGANGYVMTGETEDWLRAFQRFTQNAVHGTTTFQTWAQLLISSGDPERPAHGSDTAVHLTPERAAAIRSGSFQVVGRYLDEHLPPDDPDYLGKALKTGEAQTIIDAGLRLMPLFQYNGTQLANFVYWKGEEQGRTAHAKAREHGIPPGACIYFAVDYDAQDWEITENVIPYFRGVRDALKELGGTYQFGVYGTRNVCTRVSEATGARWSFVAGMSWGYSGNLGFPMPVNWSFNQIFEHDPEEGTGYTDGKIEPIGLDRNVWRDDADPAVSELHRDRRFEDIEDLVAFVRQVEEAYEESKWSGPQYLAPARRLVMNFFRHKKYTAVHWEAALGGVNDEWVDYVLDKGLLLPDTGPRTWPKDPVGHLPLDIQHTVATLQCTLDYYETGTRTDLGDGTGWLGDLFTLYVMWRNDYEHMNGYDFTTKYVASPHLGSAYAADDWKADADAFNLATLMHDNEIKLSEALYDYFLRPPSQGGDLRAAHRRFNRFLDGRFGGSLTTLRERVTGALLREDQSFLQQVGSMVLGRELIWTGEYPWDISRSALDDFVLGFVGRFRDETEKEPVTS